VAAEFVRFGSLFLLRVFAKNEKDNLSAAELAKLSTLAKAIVKEAKS